MISDRSILVIFITLMAGLFIGYYCGISNHTAKNEKTEVFTVPVSVTLADWYDRIIAQESGGNPNAVSHKGATGLMQIMPDTWADMTHEPYSKAKIPALNKKVGTKYLSWVQSTLRKWKGSEPTIEDILASYNGGIGRYRNRGYDLSRMPKETREYVKKILDNG